MAALLIIAVLRTNLIRREKKERAVVERWTPLIVECAERVPATLPPLGRAEAEAFLLQWCSALESLRGQAQENLREMALRIGAAKAVEDMLRSRKMRSQLLALVCIGHLRDREAIPLLIELVRDPRPLVSLIAARALMRVDAALSMPHALEGTASRTDWALAQVVSAFMECSPEDVGPALSAAIRTELFKEQRGLRAGGVARLIQVHIATRPELVREAILEVLAKSEAPSALAAALGALWHPEDVVHARKLLKHRHWPVRVAAARVLGRLGADEDFALLCSALADRSWWVRYRAAQALCSLPHADMGRLQDLASHATDRFARDILRETLAERARA